MATVVDHARSRTASQSRACDVRKKVHAILQLDLQQIAVQYEVRDTYLGVVNYAIENDELYHILDVWSVFSQSRKRVTRGFFLDLWDLLERRVAEAPEALREVWAPDARLLRGFVAYLWDGFGKLLGEIYDEEKEWRTRIAGKFSALVRRDDSGPATRFHLYALMRLYNILYEDLSEREAAKELKRQLEEAEKAIACLSHKHLVEPHRLFSKDDAGAEDAVEGQDRFIQVLCGLYALEDHFFLCDKPSHERHRLAEFVKKALATKASKQEFKDAQATENALQLERLLKYWAAREEAFEQFLADKTCYAFYEPDRGEIGALPSGSVCDQYIALVGERQVGKTSFLFASQDASWVTPPPGAPERPVARRPWPETVKNLHHTFPREREIQERIDENEKLWKESNYNPTRAWTERQIYAQTAAAGVCRFTFFDVAGEEVFSPDREGLSDWLRGYFTSRRPCALLLMFDMQRPAQPAFQAYEKVIALAREVWVEYQAPLNVLSDLPVYIVLNKSDQLVPKSGDDELRREFARALDGEAEFWQDQTHRFFSTRGMQGSATPAEVMRWVEDRRHFCKSLPYQAVCSRDLRRLHSVIGKLLEDGFRNVSLVYTSCLYRKDGEYPSLAPLWTDLTRLIHEKTSDDRQKHFDERFLVKVEDDFKKKLTEFETATELKTYPALNGGTLLKLVFGTQAQAALDFQAVIPRLGHADVNDFFDGGTNYRKLTNAIHSFRRDCGEFLAQIDSALKATLRELGIPHARALNQFNRYGGPPRLDQAPHDPRPPLATDFVADDLFQSTFVDIAAKLSDAVRAYNDGKTPGLTLDEPQVRMAVNELAERLRRQQLSADDQIFYDPEYGSLSTLCPLCDRFLTGVDSALIDTAENVVERLKQFEREIREICPLPAPLRAGAPAQPNTPQLRSEWEEKVRQEKEKRQARLCYLLKHYEPRFDQFAFTILEKDVVKLRLIKRHRERHLAQDRRLTDCVLLLLDFSGQIETHQIGEATEHSLQAAALLHLLQHNNFQVVNYFLPNPNAAQLALDQAGQLLEQAVAHRAARVKPEAIAAMNAALGAISLAPPGWTAPPTIDEVRDWKDRVAAAGRLFQAARAKVGDDAKLPEALQPINPSFALSHVANYAKRSDYLQECQLLLLLERSSYLESAGWFDGVAKRHLSFLPKVIDPTQNQVGNPDSLVAPELVYAIYMEGVAILANTPEVWKVGDHE